MQKAIVFSHTQALVFTGCMAVFGFVHHADHVLRYDHSGWPFRPEVTPFTFSLVIYPLLISILVIRNKLYRVSVSAAFALVLIGAHTFLETPLDQFATWANNSSTFSHSVGHPNLLDIRSPALGIISAILGMILNVIAVVLPFVYWREEKY